MTDVSDLKSLACQQIESKKSELFDIANTVLDNPEVGFNEHATSSLVRSYFTKMNIPYKNNLAVTGIKGKLSGLHPGPNIGVLGELDSLVVSDHPNTNINTHAAHACGHNCQIGMMIGVLFGLNHPEILRNLLYKDKQLDGLKSTSLINFDLKADSIVHAISGLPAIDLIFLFFTLVEFPLAGIIARILGKVILQIL